MTMDMEAKAMTSKRCPRCRREGGNPEGCSKCNPERLGERLRIALRQVAESATLLSVAAQSIEGLRHEREGLMDDRRYLRERLDRAAATLDEATTERDTLKVRMGYVFEGLARIVESLGGKRLEGVTITGPYFDEIHTLIGAMKAAPKVPPSAAEAMTNVPSGYKVETTAATIARLEAELADAKRAHDATKQSLELTIASHAEQLKKLRETSIPF